jgi:hypothetical protein
MKQMVLIFIEEIWPLLEKYDGSVISWRRSKRHNASLPDSVPNSYHLVGLAMDVQFDAQDQKNQFAVDARNAGFQCVVKNTVVHVELDLKEFV